MKYYSKEIIMRNTILEPKVSVTRIVNKYKDSVNIIFNVAYNGEVIRFTSGIKVDLSQWNTKDKKIKKNVALNNELEELGFHLKKSIIQLIKNNPDSNLKVIKKLFLGNYKNVNEFYQDKIQPNNGDEIYSLINLTDEYIASKSKINTIKNSQNLRYNLLKFKNTIDFNNIPTHSLNKRHFDKLLESLEKTNELSNNYIDRLFNTIRTILNWGIKEEKRVDTKLVKAVSEIKKSIEKNDVPTVALFANEFEKIKVFETDKIELVKIRDAFIFMCMTGQRLSDYINNLNKNSITSNEGVNFWNLTQDKTKKTIVVPLNELAYNILVKYKFKLPLSSVSNKKLKLLIEKVGIERKITRYKTINNKTVITKEPIYEAISLHSSRKSFVTMALEKGILGEVIRKITGHSSLVEYEKYVDIQNQSKIELVNIF